MAKKRLNSRLFSEAKEYLVGGVNSPVRAFNYVGGNPPVIKRGRGSKIYDQEGREYIDYVLSWGSLILGHAYPEVIKAVKAAADQGLGFGATNSREIELARVVLGALPFARKIRFVNSGTEAVMGAVRLARGFTKRDTIIKFENSYHGHADYLLAKGGSGLATLNIPSSAGVPRNFLKNTIIIPFADRGSLEKVFKERGSDIAAVLFEPVGGNYGLVPADMDFLRYLRKVTRKYGSLLIADEVITGFRFHFGAASELFGVEPDLIILGKIIGGGLPIGAYAGPEKIMRRLAPLGDVYQASTFSGNPVTMQAGLSTLKVLSRSKGLYEEAERLTDYLACAIEQEAFSLGIELKVINFGSVFSLRFKDKESFFRFYRRLLDSGVYFAPSEFETNFLSFAHSARDIRNTISRVRTALSALGGK